MYVVQVTPLIRGTQLETLSYFSSITYDIGTFLQVPIRGKNQTAIVTDIKPVSDNKTTLKSATFSLRKLPQQATAPTVPKSIRDTASLLAKQYPASTGALLFSLLAPDLKSGARALMSVEDVTHSGDSTPQILSARVDERFIYYQSHIRSTFATHGSVLLVVPTAIDITYAAQTLRHGIAERLIVISPLQTKRDRDKAYASLSDTSLAKLIITTPAYAYLERSDIQSIIVEQAANPYYVTRQRPYLDHRDALKAFARAGGRSILFGDTVIRTEDEVKRRQEVYYTVGEEAKRIAFSAPLTVLTQSDKPTTETPFQLYSPALVTTVERAVEGRGHVFLYAARRGLAPVVACIDCGYIFRCPDSNTPYSLIRTEKHGVEERWFVSSTSGSRVRAADVCPHCGSWRLRERGIGIQHAYSEWKALVPHCPITILDHESAPTAQKAKKIIDTFYEQKGGVLIGTQIALPYLTRGLAVSAIISLDAARATPTWRADESLFRLLMKLRECTQKEVLVQTRTEPDTLLEYAKRGAVEKFFDDEISLRQLLRYPPFQTFILLSWSGPTEPVLRAEETIKHILQSPLAQFYPSPHNTPDRQTRYALLRLNPNNQTEYEELLRRIKILPPFVKVEINPERIV